MDTTTPAEQPWKTQRGYMLVEDVTTDPNLGNLTFHGYLKGNCVHANQLVHITGFDDYEIEKIEIHPKRHNTHGRQMREEIEANLVQYATNPENLFPFSKAEEVSEDILSGLSNLKVSEAQEEKMNE